MKIEFKNEFEIDGPLDNELMRLLQKCFGKGKYDGRSYFKQLPNHRIIARINEKVVGQLGIDFRVMSLDEIPIKVFGAIDLCVNARYRNRGIGKSLMNEFERVARLNREKIDFLFLVTDVPKFYAKLGYKPANPVVAWLRLHQHKNFGVAIEKPKECKLMYKPIGKRKWTGGVLDMLGYWY